MLLLSLLYPVSIFIASANLTVNLDMPIHSVSPDLYGIFFEEINNAGDGGIYPELVRNRGFEDENRPVHWQVEGGSATIIEQASSNFNRRALKFIATKSGATLSNEGFWGMNFEAGKALNFTASIRGNLQGVRVQLLSSKGAVILDEPVSKSIKLKPQKSEPHGTFRLHFSNPGEWTIDNVSLYPQNTFNGRKDGLRSDLMRALSELKPAFVRFPGGCWVEGDVCATAQRWKQTIGNIFERKNQPNLWNYQSTNGLGYHEYLEMCEDLGAAALFVINCGMSHREVIPMDKMDEYVQDALDAIEYANGPASSKWGSIRAAAGHPKPFNLRYLEIGNENGGLEYAARYPLFYQAIKKKYPQMKLICNVWGGVPKDAPKEIIDEHYYSTPEFFMQQADRYDSYDRKGPKIYVGEYAVTQGCGNGNLRGAVGEAAFMTGMERNSDIVTMSSYAPLFSNLNAKAWNPDLIYFDSSRVVLTPSYWVQQMFGSNRPEKIVESKLEQPRTSPNHFPKGVVGVGTWRTQAEYKDLAVQIGNKIVAESSDGKALTPVTGIWSEKDGARLQSSGAEGATSLLAMPNSGNYTFKCRARKFGGDEGFLILVGQKSADSYLWMNIGGWGNSQHAIEYADGGSRQVIGKARAGSIETGRWYAIEVHYSSNRVECYLDGKLILEAEPPNQKSLFATAGVDKIGKPIVKIVNATSQEVEMTMNLIDRSGRARNADLWTLSSSSPKDENTLQDPNRVRPKYSRLEMNGKKLTLRLKSNSVNVLKF